VLQPIGQKLWQGAQIRPKTSAACAIFASPPTFTKLSIYQSLEYLDVATSNMQFDNLLLISLSPQIGGITENVTEEDHGCWLYRW
jgi:hypothetical protein